MGDRYNVHFEWLSKFSGDITGDGKDITAESLLKELSDDRKNSYDFIDMIVDNGKEKFKSKDKITSIEVTNLNTGETIVEVMESEGDITEKLKNNIKDKYYHIKNMDEKISSLKKENNKKDAEIERLKKKLKENKREVRKRDYKLKKAYKELDHILKLKKDLIPLVKRMMVLQDDIPFLRGFLNLNEGLSYGEFRDVLEDIIEVYSDNINIPENLIDVREKKKETALIEVS